MFADGTTLVLDREEMLPGLKRKFSHACKKRKLKVNVIISTLMRISGNSLENAVNLKLDGRATEEVITYRYLWANVNDGIMIEGASHRIGDVRKAMGPITSLWNRRYTSRKQNMI